MACRQINLFMGLVDFYFGDWTYSCVLLWILGGKNCWIVGFCCACVGFHFNPNLPRILRSPQTKGRYKKRGKKYDMKI